MADMRYSLDFRLKVLAAYDRGLTAKQTATKFDTAEHTVFQFLRRRREGRLAPDTPGPKKPTKITPEDKQIIRQLVAKQPGITLKELIAHISVPVAESTMSRTLKRLGITFKKRH